MKIKNLLFNTLVALTICMPFASCNNEENTPNDNGSKIELPQKRAYILYEGSSAESNDAGIAFYAPNNDADFQKDIFKLQNGKGLGALANSLIEYDNNIYVVVSTSKYISKLNEACVEVGTYKFPKGEGDPRYITAKDGFLYVTQWGGKVSKINAKTMERVAEFNGGDNLEGIVECNGKLYVANSFKTFSEQNEEVLVINPKTMKLENELKVALNPNRIIEEDGKIFLLSYGNFGNIDYTVQMINPDNNTIVDLQPATLMGKGNDVIYFVYSKTDWTTNPPSTKNTFFSYNVKTQTLNNTSFLKNAPEKLMSTSVYMISVDDYTDEIYIGTTDYTTTGTIYRFDENGNLKETFNAGGINPNNIIFLD